MFNSGLGASMKINASDYLELAICVYKDAVAKCSADVRYLRDLDTLRSRVEKEGLSFLTITLPDFSRDFERSLELGHIEKTFFRSFRKNGSIPAFLSGMISQIFDRRTGRILDVKTTSSNDACPPCTSTIIECVRQICLAFKKVEVPCSSARNYTAIKGYTEIEQSFDMFSLPREDTDKFSFVSFVLWSRMLRTLRPDMCIPRHGPGATAERISGNSKYIWRSWYDRLEPYFPSLESAYSIGAQLSKEFEKLTIVSGTDELPVRVTPVPKTLKGPRIIAIEPVCMQYVQQGLRDILYDALESDDISSGHVNFRDQSINQKLALSASSSGQLATIDLSEASDRVPWSLAKEMFSSNPDLLGAIEACRSTHAELPGGQIIGPLKKFASMGSALCFPVEAMYFYTICVMALLEVHNLPVSYANCFIVSRSVYVYGDDIIVPATYAEIVLDYLRKYNCKVNANKTFYLGKFRESCGVDAYDGTEVTPVYVRKQKPENKQSADALISWVATSNLFEQKGFYLSAKFMRNTCELILGPLPIVSGDTSVLGRISKNGVYSVERWNKLLHRFEVKAWIPSPVFREDKLDYRNGYGALKKCLTILETRASGSLGVDTPFEVIVDKKGRFTIGSSSVDDRHLERSALHGAVTLKRRWVAAH
jgi:hypothetical protein